MEIPLLDLKRQYLQIRTDAEAAVHSVLASGSYIMGENVLHFEREFASYCGVKHAVSVANGTDGLTIALRSLGIRPGDEVITSPFTFFATAESISSVGARPVFVDVRSDTFNIDETLIEAAITENTRAIMPVHLFGQTAAMDEINHIAEKYGLRVVEDACQAAGACYKGKKTGSLGHMGVFSFFPSKNLSCAGDGGMITTNDDRLAVICRALRSHGSGEAGRQAFYYMDSENCEPTDDDIPCNKYCNYLIGYNSRMDEIQAAILRIKLKKLDSYNRRRREISAVYNRELQETGYITPATVPDNEPAFHLYVLQCENREQIIEYLQQKGIGTGIYYPVPQHLQKAFRELNYVPGTMPAAEYFTRHTFAIPCFPEMTAEEQAYIIQTLKDALGTLKGGLNNG